MIYISSHTMKNMPLKKTRTVSRYIKNLLSFLMPSCLRTIFPPRKTLVFESVLATGILPHSFYPFQYQVISRHLPYILSPALSFALLALGFCAISDSEARTGFLLIIFKTGLTLHLHSGNLGGQIQPFAFLLKTSFTILSSNEW